LIKSDSKDIYDVTKFAFQINAVLSLLFIKESRGEISHSFHKNVKGELRRKMNLWSNKTSVHSQPFSGICFHDNRM